MKMKAYTVCARAQASIFYGCLAIQSKKIAKLLKKSEQWPNKRSKVKTLEDKPRSGWPFFPNCVRHIIEKPVSICVIIPQNRKVKKFQLHIIDQRFKYNSMGISYRKKLESLEEKMQCTLHASMVSEGFANFIPKEDRPANSRDVNPLETIWIIVDEATYKDPTPKHWMSLDSDFASRGRMWL